LTIITFLAAHITILAACTEIPPLVIGIQPPQAVNDQKTQVLVEEFTGVRCVNCPAGSVALTELKKIHGNQLVVVSIHAGEFSPPYAQSKYDFRTPEGNQLLDYLERPFAYPTAIINRTKFDGQFGLQLGMGNWAGFIVIAKNIEPMAKLEINSTFNRLTRNLEVSVRIFIQDNINTKALNLSVMITEDNIVDLQLAPGSTTPKADYVHNHNLRKMLTKFDGDPLGIVLSPGLQIDRNFQFIVPEGWKENDCQVIAFVHHPSPEKRIIQAHQKRIVN
jgi:hypothetical protein